VCKSHEFNSRFYGKVILYEDSIPLLKVISEFLERSFVIVNQFDDEFNPVDIYKLEYYLLNYFNRIQVTHNNDSTKTIYLYKNNKNYNTFYFFEEIEALTNRISSEFGIDENNRMHYNPENENRELTEGTWKGRIWRNEKSLIEFQMLEAPSLLTLTIHFK